MTAQTMSNKQPINMPLYNYTETDRQQQAIARYYEQYMIPTVLFIVFYVIGLPGNVIVLLIQWKEKTMTITKLFIFAIAIIDLLSIMIAYPINVIYSQYWLSISNVTFCKFYWGVNVTCTMPGVLMMFGLSVVRYYRVCRPQRLHVIEKNVKWFFLFVSALSLTFTGLIITVKGKQKRPDEDISLGLPGYLCNTSDYYRNTIVYMLTNGLGAVVFLFCIVCIMFTNSLIFRKMLKQRQLLSNQAMSTRHKHRNRRSTVKKVERKNDIKSKDRRDTRDFVANSPQCEEGIKTVQDIQKQPDSSQIKSPVESMPTLPVVDKSKSQNSNTNVNNNVNNIAIETRTIENVKENERVFKKKSTSCQCCNSCFKGVSRETLKVFVVNAIYISAYLPFFACDFLENTGPRKSRLTLYELYFVINISRIFPLLRCALNPLIYHLLDPSFRYKCRSLRKKGRKYSREFSRKYSRKYSRTQK